MRSHRDPAGPPVGRRTGPGYPAAGHPDHGRRGGRGLPGWQGRLPAPGRPPADPRGGLRRADPEPGRGGAAAVEDQAAGLGGGRGDAVGRCWSSSAWPSPSVTRWPTGSATWPRSCPTYVTDARARPRLDRAPGAQVPRPDLGAEERAQAGQLRRGPGQARADPGQGRALAAAGAVHHLRPGAAPAARGPEDADRPAGRDGPGAGGAVLPDRRTRSTGRSPGTCSATSSPR